MRAKLDAESGFAGARVRSVGISASHAFSKTPCEEISLIAGLGIAGDAHSGETVKHRSRVAVDPRQPNLRQVHLIHSELFRELAAKGFALEAGDLGENILTEGLALLDLPRGTWLRLGADAVVEVTGLRNPCRQIESFRTGLLRHMVATDEATGEVVRKTGIMGVVRRAGIVRPGDRIGVTLPAEPWNALVPV